MAVARNLAEHGVWGVTRYEFTSSTSSLAWPLLLAAADLVVGVRAERAPRAQRRVRGGRGRAWPVGCCATCGRAPRAAALVAFVLLTPLPILVLAGHGAHAARSPPSSGCSTACAPRTSHGTAAHGACSSRWPRPPPSPPPPATSRCSWSCPPSSPSPVTSAAAAAAATALGGAPSPRGLRRAVSLSHGWPPLPNSLLLKRATFEARGLGGLLDRMGGHAPAHAGRDSPSARPAPGRARSLRRPARAARRAPLGRDLRGGHAPAPSARGGGMAVRYEAYLVAFGIVLVARHRRQRRSLGSRPTAPGPLARWPWPRWWRPRLSALTRAVQSMREGPAAVKNIYEQQYQMGLFLRELPTGVHGDGQRHRRHQLPGRRAPRRPLRPGHPGDGARPARRAGRSRAADPAGRGDAAGGGGRVPVLVRGRAAPRTGSRSAPGRCPTRSWWPTERSPSTRPAPEPAALLAAALSAFQPRLPATVVRPHRAPCPAP